MNCLEYLINLGYNLNGYSPDTYLYLANSTPSSPTECEARLAYAGATWG